MSLIHSITRFRADEKKSPTSSFCFSPADSFAWILFGELTCITVTKRTKEAISSLPKKKESCRNLNSFWTEGKKLKLLLDSEVNASLLAHIPCRKKENIKAEREIFQHQVDSTTPLTTRLCRTGIKWKIKSRNNSK